MPGYLGAHGKQGIDSCRYPFTTPGSRETTVSKMPCLGAYAPGGTRTTQPLWLRVKSANHYTTVLSQHTYIHLSSNFLNQYLTSWSSGVLVIKILAAEGNKWYKVKLKTWGFANVHRTGCFLSLLLVIKFVGTDDVALTFNRHIFDTLG